MKQNNTSYCQSHCLLHVHYNVPVLALEVKCQMSFVLILHKSVV